MDRDGIKLVLSDRYVPRCRVCGCLARYGLQRARQGQGLGRADDHLAVETVRGIHRRKLLGPQRHPTTDRLVQVCSHPASTSFHAAGWSNAHSPGSRITGGSARDYERLCATSEAWIYLAMIRLMLRRLARF